MILLFFFINDLYPLIPAVIAQMFIFTAQHVIPRELATNEANVEIQMQPVTLETRISKCPR